MDARQALSELGVAFLESGAHHHISHNWLGMDCPRCSPGTGRYRLGYNLAGGYLSCWLCGGLPLVPTLAELSGRPMREVSLLFGEIERPRRESVLRAKGKLVLPDGLGPLKPVHERYLKGRGFDPEALRKVWKIKGIGRMSLPGLAWRVFVPIHHQGETVSWTCRATDPASGDRYRNAKPNQEALPAKSLLYGADHCRHGVIIHEGPTDCWRTGPGAAAVMGLTYTRAQVRLIAAHPVRAVVFDSGPDAQRRAKQLCEDLAVLPGVTHRIEMDAEDPGSASEREVRLLRRVLA